MSIGLKKDLASTPGFLLRVQKYRRCSAIWQRRLAGHEMLWGLCLHVALDPHITEIASEQRDYSVPQTNCSERGHWWICILGTIQRIFNMMMEDQREDKWEKLTEKEEKRIRKYLE
ncbi:uncharacterized protein LOC133192511 [Saccostrea echinata]|uniref:uncharacterized protein LOC133192511 n=1 Tax=Saccostrea echinata TaxID=191078 RepID=UPI002A82CEF7|nr:uncharacterized protein LOC133192511 [Saccostrea echinata]